MNRRAVLALPLCAPVFWCGLPNDANAALVPPVFLDCVVALGFSGPALQNGVLTQNVWQTIGTGFIFGYLFKDDPDVTKKLYTTYLVTAKHVVDDCTKISATNPSLGGMKVRVNSVEPGSVGTVFDLVNDIAERGAIWTLNPNGKDVAVIEANIGSLRDKKFDSMFFASDVNVAGIDKLKSLDVSAGDGVFVLGFPMGMAGAQKNYVIVRQGVIARVSELVEHAVDYFLIDSFVFPGNSGGPVILKPEIAAIEGTKGNRVAYLIGLVIESIDYVDTAVSQQTGHPRISFEENAGLGKILPTDYIVDAILAAQSKSSSQKPDAKHK